MLVSDGYVEDCTAAGDVEPSFFFVLVRSLLYCCGEA